MLYNRQLLEAAGILGIFMSQFEFSPQGPFTLSDCESDIANNWILLAYMQLFTSNGVVAVSNTYRDDISDGYSIPDEKPTIGYSIPDEIPTTCFQVCELV